MVLPKVQEPQGGACSVEHLSLVEQNQCFILASAFKIAAAGCKVYFFIHKRLVVLQGWKSSPAQIATLVEASLSHEMTPTVYPVVFLVPRAG